MYACVRINNFENTYLTVNWTCSIVVAKTSIVSHGGTIRLSNVVLRIIAAKHEESVPPGPFSSMHCDSGTTLFSCHHSFV